VWLVISRDSGQKKPPRAGTSRGSHQCRQKGRLILEELQEVNQKLEVHAEAVVSVEGGLILEELQKVNQKLEVLVGHIQKVNQKLEVLAGTVGALTHKCGTLEESKLRHDAAERNGHSYAKRLEVTALIDIVHFLCKKNYKYVRSDDNDSSEEALRCLVATAGGYMAPVARAFVGGNKGVRLELDHILSELTTNCDLENPLNFQNLYPLKVLSCAIEEESKKS
jgi:hypothetical protein